MRAAQTLLLAALIAGLAACSSSGSHAVAPHKCAIIGSWGGAIAGNAVGIDRGRSGVSKRAGYIAGGAAAGAAAGYALCDGIRADAIPPTVRVVAEPMEGEVALEVELRGTADDPDGEIVAYEWTFGDGQGAMTKSASHTYEEPGDYTATLVVSDNDGLIGTASVPIHALEPPPPPPPAPKKIVLRGVNFDFDHYNIRDDAQVILDAAIEVLGEDLEVNVQIEGHTDSKGSERYNMNLSMRRATAVAIYLVDAGIDSMRLRSAGFGEGDPVASNDDEDGRTENRRVVLRIEAAPEE